MSAQTPGIRAAEASDFPGLVSVLVAAFENDPLAVWLYPYAAARRLNHRVLFEATLAEPGEGSMIDMTESGDCVAIWRRVSEPIPGDAPPGAGPAAAELFTRIAAAAPAPPFWNLAFIGAREQGQGRGSAMIRHRLSHLAGSVSLWTANPANLPFYERMGLSISSHIRVRGIDVWWLTR